MRIWEIDFLRGLAVLLMILFHFIVDLHDFFSVSLDYQGGFFFLIGKLSACLFIFIAGISTRFSRNPFRHGLRVLFWGFTITGVTYLYEPTTYIRFGILHLLGSSLLFASFLRRYQAWQQSILGVFILLIGNFWPGNRWLRQSWLLPLGYPPANFATLDYYPLFPWFGLFLLGMAGGIWFYPTRRSLFAQSPPDTPLHFLGRHALAVYLLHQPFLLLLLTCLFSLR